MATKSILKSIFIKDKHMSRTLTNALEQAQNKASKEVVFQKAVRDIKGDDIKKIFGE